ncbi:MAG: Flp pilus assembly complex ATPase component TadA [Fimbriimonadaceae bacterium]|nr:Flp pilus assembly complex ATPase component TadA [Fimbriimonadaceae bacterium]
MTDPPVSTSMISVYAGLGIPTVDLEEVKPDPAVAALVPPDFALKRQVLPLHLRGEVLVAAIGRPEALASLDELAVLLGRPVEPVLADPALIKDRIEQKFLSGMLEEIPTDDSTTIDAETDDLADLTRMAGEAQVVQMVNLMFAQAVRDGVSDIHIEPYEKEIKVRYRVDGILFETLKPPRRMHNALISRLKILGEMNIAERRLPQDGRIKLTIAGRQVDVRVSVIPTVHGERAVLRILDKGQSTRTLPELGMRPDSLEIFRKLINIPYGMILVTGPTGSGKSTTLYAALQEIYSPKRNILTIEDPVEYQLPGVGQIQVRAGIGLTFASGLRSIVRQDPDVIMVGEIRDHETAEIAIHAALTGHLVFSTLHTNDAPSALTRLLDMGVEPYLAASSVVGVLAQRLVRRNCPTCSVPDTPDPEALEAVGITPEEAKTATFRIGKGCEKCGGTGFRGRLAIHELLVVDETIRRMTVDRAPASNMRDHAIQHQGMRTLLGSGRLCVLEGTTTADDVLRVCQREDLE